LLRWKTPWVGDPGYIHEFKRQWIRGYRDVIKAAADEYDVPELLVAGVAYTEVGGDPRWADGLQLAVRRFDQTVDPWNVAGEPQLTSFLDVSIQIRRAAETLALEPEKITTQQEDLIAAVLSEPRINIFVAAKHLAELRDVDFRGKGADTMSMDEIMVTATRYNRGPEPSIESIRRNMSYGKSILKRAEIINRLLSD
jgi:hypothetical protein